jgi:hypothetical protein
MNFRYVLFIIIGIITMVIGLIGIVVYSALFQLSPVIENILSQKINTSGYFLYVILFITFAGLTMMIHSFFHGYQDRNSVFLVITTILLAISLGIQAYRLIELGPAWIGVEFLQSKGYNKDMTIVSGGLFLYNLILLAMCLAEINSERKE